MEINVGILGEYLPDKLPRKTIEPALQHSANQLNILLFTRWIENDCISFTLLSNYDALFIAPGSAIEDTDNIIQAIHYARENDVPCLGTCGGFQRILTEYALNVLRFEQVFHAEKDPSALAPLFSNMVCSTNDRTNEVILKNPKKSLVSYDAPVIKEDFYCDYGLNPLYIQQFEESGIFFSGEDKDGEARIIELKNHPFMVGTLFVPQVKSTKEYPHPVITSFLQRAVEQKSKHEKV